ncbi:unnamed protein product [Owenia fusiformis]|uniref:PDZ domain-containing protein n=1 Tax=Owenia fusiformis TaxID=6347 RepID=A0A8J1XRD0_OWEFU|nr:unnamed protein product [Owenia fusiformis]CAH1789523.1 unnamed protein product [Owenia fusiformis]
MCSVVKLRRTNNSIQWGFTLEGGVDQGYPLYIKTIVPGSPAQKHGLAPGDAVMRIGFEDCPGMNLSAGKAEVLRQGNQLDLVVEKGAVQPDDPRVRAAAENAPRVELVEETSPFINQPGSGPKFKDVKPKTYTVLDQELPESEKGGGKPSSIFDRKREERSKYQQATGPTIQKAYGQKK